MSGIVKVLTGIFGVIAVIACLGTIGIIGYSTLKSDDGEDVETVQETWYPTPVPAVPTAVPTQSPSPESEGGMGIIPMPVINKASDPDHTHDYEESIEKNATCYSAGKIKYTCKECGDIYYVDVMSTGHVADEWELSRKPTDEMDGLRVKKCIYCDEIVAQEKVPFEDESKSEEDEGEQAPHVHQYTASVDREPTCILAGLRKYTCSCGDFYTEKISAPGHIATDWTVAAAPTTTTMGTEQITCTVCGTLLDSRPMPVASASPGASASNNSASAAPTATPRSSATPAGSSSPSAAPSASAVPTASPHAHEFKSYILKEANCQEAGIRSFVCSSCGSSYAEPIPADTNRHTYRSMVIPPTKTTQGYTIYTCIRCNHSYNDNYTPALGG